MKFFFEEWTDREKGLKRQNKKATRGGESSGGPCGEMVSEGHCVCVCVSESKREMRGWGQALGLQLKVHTLAKIWVLSRQRSCGPFRGSSSPEGNVFEALVGSAN